MQEMYSVLTALAAPLTAHSQQAPEVQWRTDYNTARKEAEQMHRPLMVDFGTDLLMLLMTAEKITRLV